jgi:flagellar M-ring protein FliF
MAGLNDATQQAKTFWGSRNASQKGLLLVGAGATILMLAYFTKMIGTPDYKPLFTGLEPADAQTLSAQLDAQGIQHEASADGKTISVPGDKLDAARLQTASQGTPHSGRMGFELFDKMSWGQTEFDEKVTYQRALEGELERTIQTMKDVESARVHLVMANDSVFLDHQRGAKASVILKLRRNGLPKESVLAVSRLVSAAVDELKPEDVSIVDADSGRALSSGHGADDGEAAESTLTQRLVSTLEPVVGMDKIRASVNVDYNQSTTEQKEEKYDPDVSALLSDQKTEDTAGGAAPAASGIAGTSSNVPTKSATATTNADGSQTSKSETAQYGVNKTEIHTVQPAGKVERVTAAILVDDAIVKTTDSKGKSTYKKVKRSPDEMEKIQKLAEEVIGFNKERGDSISVQNLSFDTNQVPEDLPVPTAIQKTEKTVTEYSGLLRPASLLVLFLLAYMFVLRPVQKHALAPGQPQMAMQPALPGGADVERLSASSHAVDPATETRRAAQLRDHTIETIKLKPVNTARAVQAWIREEPS